MADIKLELYHRIWDESTEMLQGTDIYDISELAISIDYSTSIKGFPGKLTINIVNDKDNDFEVSHGDMIKFWYEGFATFKGYVFDLQGDEKEEFQIIAYDQMRYLQNRDYFMVAGNETLREVFEKICVAKLELTDGNITQRKMIDNYSIVEANQKLSEAKVFEDASYFDILAWAIDRVHIASQESEFGKLVTTVFSIGERVVFSGGKSWESPNDDTPTTTNRDKDYAHITLISRGSKHPYHVISDEIDADGNVLIPNAKPVYGWVDAKQLSKPPAWKYELDKNHYFITDNFGTLELNYLHFGLRVAKEQENEIADRESIIIIGDDSLLNNYSYKSDIDKNTYNEFILVAESQEDEKGNKAKEIVYGTQDTFSVKKWGRLRKFITVKQGATAEELSRYAKLIKEVESKPTKTLNLNCIGYNGLYAGNAVALDIAKLGLNNIPVYILQATHHYDGDGHTMDLEVSTQGNFPEGLNV